MTSSYRFQPDRVLLIVLAISLRAQADPVKQDFSATFSPSGVTVVLVDAFGNTFAPFQDRLVPGLTAYDGRVAFRRAVCHNELDTTWRVPATESVKPAGACASQGAPQSRRSGYAVVVGGHE